MRDDEERKSGCGIGGNVAARNTMNQAMPRNLHSGRVDYAANKRRDIDSGFNRDRQDRPEWLKRALDVLAQMSEHLR
jgi:hypothetical protein